MKETLFLHKKRYRFFYPAGLISLVLLPLIGIGYLNYKHHFDPEYALEINMWSPQLHKSDPELFPENPIPERKYQKFEMTGERKADFEKLASVQTSVRKLLAQNDSVSGVHIEFGEKAKYETLVEAVNICRKENARTYLYYGNGFYIMKLNPKPAKAEHQFEPFCATRNYLFEEEPVIKPLTTKEILLKHYNNFEKVFKALWPLSFMYVGLLFFSFINLKNRYKTNKLTTTY